MDPVSVSSLVAAAKGLLVIVRVVRAKLKKFEALHTAAVKPLSVGNNANDPLFSETLNRLIFIDNSKGWWGKFLAGLDIDAINPEFFRDEDVQTWMNNEQNQEDLKTLAQYQLAHINTDVSEIKKRLKSAFQGEWPGEGEDYSPTDIVTAVLCASAYNELTLGERVGLGVSQTHAAHMDQRFDQVMFAITENGSTDENAQNRAYEELTLILRSRGIHNYNAESYLKDLVLRCAEGAEFSNISEELKSLIRFWAARTYTALGQTTDLEEIKNTIVEELLPAEVCFASIQAYELANAGNVDAAIELLKANSSADANATIWSILLHHASAEAALDWFDQIEVLNAELFTPIGWRNVLVTLMTNRRWNDAVKCAKLLDDTYFERYPDLAFIVGVVNSVMLTPESMRELLLKGQIFLTGTDYLEGGETDYFRSVAQSAFEKAKFYLADISQTARANAADEYLTWLDLSDRNKRAEAIESIKSRMTNIDDAIKFAGFAYAWGLSYDSNLLKVDFQNKRKNESVSHEDLQANFYRVKQFGTPEDLIDFLISNRALYEKEFEKGRFPYFLIEVYMESNQARRALETIEEYAEEFSQSDYHRIKEQIEAYIDDDPTVKLIELYNDGRDEIHLRNLVSFLRANRDWKTLSKYALEEFKVVQNVATASLYAQSLTETGEFNKCAVFLKSVQDLRSLSLDLEAEFAWASFRAGHHDDVREAVNRLINERDDQNDRVLDIQLSLQTGEWERINSIVEREKVLIDKRSASFVLQLAGLISDSERETAIELIKAAVDKAEDDPQILLNAYHLCTSFGAENIAHSWLSKAITLSGEDGPIQSFSLKELAENAPKWSEYSNHVWEKYWAGEIPMHMAAQQWNVSLSEILISNALFNEQAIDPRKKILIPIRSGGRLIHSFEKIDRLGVDLTSMLVAAKFDFLEILEQSANKLVISSDTLPLMLTEIRKIRFHQPSKISEAKLLRKYLDDEKFKILKKPAQPPNWLVDEVGVELATLLESAKNEKGFVVRPLPIFKAGSLYEEIADLKDYDDLIRTPMDVYEWMRSLGKCDESTFGKVCTYLKNIRADHTTGRNEIPLGPIYFDGLSITYLNTCNGMHPFFELSKDLYVPLSLRDEVKALIRKEETSQEVENLLSKLRIWLRNGIRKGSIKLLPMTYDEDGSSPIVDGTLVAIRNLMQYSSEYDALLADDRLIGKAPSMLAVQDGKSIPIIGLLDLQHHLATLGKIPEAHFFQLLHKTRTCGYVTHPVLPKEMDWAINNSSFTEDGAHFIASAELKSIRDIFLKIRSSELLKLPDESNVLHLLHLAVLNAIRTTWADEQLSIEQAKARSSWILENLYPYQENWIYPASPDVSNEDISKKIASSFELLCVSVSADGKRNDAFSSWVSDTLENRYSITQTDVLDILAEIVGERIIKDVQSRH
ncbi:hypothetical protein [Terasakiella sp.]|uniref:HTH domain-containing protein n=1 Tax=Terasakiella sp. TaxID=2034861 RepID=UPI003AA7B880